MQPRTSQSQSGQSRLHHLDWLRVLAVLLLIPVHTARIFDSFEPFYIKSQDTSELLTWGVIAFFNTWHMPLLFLIAGAGSYLALSVRSPGGFGRERALRLLVPFLFGVLVLVPPQAYVGAVTNAGFQGDYWSFLAGYFIPTDDLSGYFGTFTPGQLWFILFLLIYSFAALPLFVWARRPANADRVQYVTNVLTSRRLLWVPVLALWLSEAVPDLGGKNLIYFFLFFAAGAAYAASNIVRQRVERWWKWSALVGIASTAVLMAVSIRSYPLADWSAASVVVSLLRSINSWSILVLMLGAAAATLNRPGRLLSLANEGAYPFYLLHQTVIVLSGWWILSRPLGVDCRYVAICLASLAGTILVYVGFVKPWNPVRWLFGMKHTRRGRSRCNDGR